MGKTYRPDYGKHRRQPKPPKSRHHKRLEDSDLVEDDLPDTDLTKEDDTPWKP
jgi:hypothetical protein